MPQKYIHKYVSDGDAFYRVAEKPGRPGGSANIQSKEWMGAATGQKVQNALKFLNSLSFSREDKPEEEVMEEVKVEKKAVHTLADYMRSVAVKMAVGEEKTEETSEEGE
jgi:hypothetical protein